MHLLFIYSHSSEEFSRTARYSVNTMFLTNTVNNYQTCYPLKNPSVQPCWNTCSGADGPPPSTPQHLFLGFTKWDEKCPKPKRTECYLCWLLGDRPDPPSRSVALSLPILSCSALTSSGKKQVLTRPKQQLIHRQRVYTQVQTDKPKSRNQLLCCVLELQWQHPNTMYIH